MPEKFDVQAVLRDFRASRNHAEAVSQLSRRSEPDVLYKISQAYPDEKDFGAKEVLIDALVKLAGTMPQAVHLLGKMRRTEKEWTLRRNVVKAIEKTGSDAGRQYLEETREDAKESREIRRIAASALETISRGGTPAAKVEMPAHLFKSAEQKPAQQAPAEERPIFARLREVGLVPPLDHSFKSVLSPLQAGVLEELGHFGGGKATHAQVAERRGTLPNNIHSSEFIALQKIYDHAFAQKKMREGTAGSVALGSLLKASDATLARLSKNRIGTLGELAGHSRGELRTKLGLQETQVIKAEQLVKRFGLRFRE